MERHSEAGGLAVAAGGYLVIIEEGPDGYGAYVPDLPLVFAVADTREEVEQLMREGIAFHLELLRERGEPIPAPTTTAITVAG